MAPHARQAISLQLHRHRQLIRAGAALSLLRLADLPADAQHRLHVMPHLVRDYVRSGEISRRAEALIELPEERQIEINLAIGRAVKGPARRRSTAACGLD